MKADRILLVTPLGMHEYYIVWPNVNLYTSASEIDRNYKTDDELIILKLRC